MSHDDPNIPQRLADDLADFADARIFVPGEIDDAILAEARRRLAPAGAEPVAANRGWSIGAPVAGAIAAAVLLGVSLWMLQATSYDSDFTQSRVHLNDDAAPVAADADAALVREDVDGSGVVDIVDALILARSIEAGTAPDSTFDYTADGVVDQNDVDHVARRAVALHTPGGAG